AGSIETCTMALAFGGDLRAYMRLFKRICMRVKDGSVLGGRRSQVQATEAVKQCFACHQPKKRPGLRLFYLHSVKRDKRRNESAIPRSANSTRSPRARQTMRAAQAYSLDHARLSIGMGAS